MFAFVFRWTERRATRATMAEAVYAVVSMIRISNLILF